jgi:hypothetical protein
MKRNHIRDIRFYQWPSIAFVAFRDIATEREIATIELLRI